MVYVKAGCLLLLLVCLTCQAMTSNKMYIFFINGINSTIDDADYNLTKLENLISYQEDNLSWDLLYNSTHGLIKSDIWDYFNQKRQERKGYSISRYVDHYVNSNNIECCKDPKQYEDIKTKIEEKYLNDDRFVGKNLYNIVHQFHRRIPKDITNVYVLIIAHSQGNEYANQLWDYLVNGEGFPNDRIAIIAIASPTMEIKGISLGSMKYITGDNDKIINGARIIHPSILKGNIHLNKCKDFGCHSFIDSYLYDKKSSKIICNQIKSYITLWLNGNPVC